MLFENFFRNISFTLFFLLSGLFSLSSLSIRSIFALSPFRDSLNIISYLVRFVKRFFKKVFSLSSLAFLVGPKVLFFASDSLEAFRFA